MFDEYGCGCVVSRLVGRVRICEAHALEKATGDGGIGGVHRLRNIVRTYPAHGEMPDNWRGR